MRNEVVAMIFFSPHQLQDRLAHIHAQTTHPSTLLTPPSRPPDRSLPSINSNSVVILSFHVWFLCFLMSFGILSFLSSSSLSHSFLLSLVGGRKEKKRGWWMEWRMKKEERAVWTTKTNVAVYSTLSSNVWIQGLILFEARTKVNDDSTPRPGQVPSLHKATARASRQITR